MLLHRLLSTAAAPAPAPAPAGTAAAETHGQDMAARVPGGEPSAARAAEDGGSDDAGSLRSLEEKAAEASGAAAKVVGATSTAVVGFLVRGRPRSGRSSLLFQSGLKRSLGSQDGVCVYVCKRDKMRANPPVLSRRGSGLGFDQALKRILIKYIESHEDLVAYLGDMHVSDPQAHTLLIDDLDLYCQEALDKELQQTRLSPSEQKAVLISTAALVLALAQSACKAFARGAAATTLQEAVFGVAVGTGGGQGRSGWDIAHFVNPWIPKTRCFDIRDGEVRRPLDNGEIERLDVRFIGASASASPELHVGPHDTV